MRARKALDYLSPYEYVTDKRVSYIAVLLNIYSGIFHCKLSLLV